MLASPLVHLLALPPPLRTDGSTEQLLAGAWTATGPVLGLVAVHSAVVVAAAAVDCCDCLELVVTLNCDQMSLAVAEAEVERYSLHFQLGTGGVGWCKER